MAVTFGSINGEESATVTFRVETVTIDHNSTIVNREILVVGSPQSSNGLVAVVASSPASTEFGMVVRPCVVAASATLSNVAANSSNVTVVASNAARRGAILFNDSPQASYLKFGATASTGDFTYKVFPSQTLELPVPIYTGQIDALWDSTTSGNMRVTEIA